jgi:tyrocidine synthetase-3
LWQCYEVHSMRIDRKELRKLIISAQQRKKEKEYWLERLSGEWEKSIFPYDYPPHLSGERSLKSTDFKIAGKTAAQLLKMSKGSDYTLNAIFHAALAVVLSRYNGSRDIIVGLPIYKKERVGDYINPVLALRNRLTERMTFKELLLQVRQNLMEALENCNYPLQLLAGHLNIPEEQDSDFPLFDVALVIENIQEKEFLLGLECSMVFSFARDRQSLQGVVEYDSSRYCSDSVERISNHFFLVLQELLFHVDRPVNGFDILSAREKHQVLYEFNNTEAEDPKDKTIHRLFADQVERTPDHMAILGPTLWEKASRFVHRLTYAKLNEKADQLAHLLRARGVRADTVVGISVERSIEMVMGILGILKAGGGYLPIDPESPQERIDYLLKDSKAGILLTANEIHEALRVPGKMFKTPVSSPAKNVNLAYVIYTSGSTGKPKGVVVEHRSVINFIKGITDVIPFRESARILSLTTLGFDIFGLETLVPFSQGSGVVLGSREEQLDTAAASIIIRREHISLFQVTPSRLQMMISLPGTEASLGLLEFLLVGGEPFPGPLLEKARPLLRGKIYNMYGPTETTIWSTLKDLSGNEALNIGKPIANTRIYIIDNMLRLQPLGVAGELTIGGLGLARGYLNRPELTAEKFDLDLGDYQDYPEEKRLHFNGPGLTALPPGCRRQGIYRTGDLARWLPDGNIEFLGRLDHQVKLRGFRIELGEIENQILKHKEIKDAVVVTRSHGEEDKCLCAYIVSDRDIPIPGLKDFLSKQLPGYMIPAFFMRLQQIPLTVNGKVDRKALPSPRIEVDREYLAPGNRIERKLVEIWAELLNLREDTISITANFFHLGGHSLIIAILAARIYQETNVIVSYEEMFKKPTIRALSRYITAAAKGNYSAINPVEKREYYQLSSAQKRLYILQQMEAGNIAYNLPLVIPPREPLEKEKLESVFKRLMIGHESLRTSFITVKEEPVQKIQEEIDFSIRGIDVSEEEVEHIIYNFPRPFDLSQAPLLRVELLTVNFTRQILLVDIHHIITDGISQTILEKEFLRLYSGEELPLLRLQYRDYAAWQASEGQTLLINQQQRYWLETFAGEVPVLNLPTDYPRPVMQNFAGSRVNFFLAVEDNRKLKDLAKQTDTTVFMCILSLFTILLSRLSGQEDIVVGTPVAARRHADLEKIIGMFVNTLPLRNMIIGQQNYLAFLEEVKRKTLQAYENQEYPFEKLVETLEVNRDTSRNPIFDVMFNFLNLEEYNDDILESLGEEQDQSRHRKGISKFDLTLTVVDLGERFLVSFEYCTRLFKPETIDRFISYLRRLLASLSKYPYAKLFGMEIISEAERSRILYEFNDTASGSTVGETIYELFAEQVQRTPAQIAMVGPSVGSIHESAQQVTYRELNEKSNRLAQGLKEEGIGPDTIVGIQVERSVEMIVGVLGILKAGGAYLPIDPDCPRDRTQYMLNDSGAASLLTGNEWWDYADNGLASPGFLPAACNRRPVTSLAYVIYTSGTTGNPKGVGIEHRSLVNRLNWMQKKYPIDQKDTILHKTAFTFDVSVWEIFWWSMVGAKVCLTLPGREKDPETITLTVERNHVTVMHFVPSMLSVFLDYLAGSGKVKKLSGLKQVIASGEALLPLQVERFNELLNKENGTLLANLYGPTEATIDVSYFDCSAAREREIIPLGKPIDNLRLYILDHYLHLQPVGISGELCISGIGLARGYLNRPELTAEKFINEALSSWLLAVRKTGRAENILGGHVQPGVNQEILKTRSQTIAANPSTLRAKSQELRAKLYKTGDLARWLPDGNIEFLGRLDHQVKLRGFRIELGEIEKQLLKHKEIKEAVVVTRGCGEEDKCLCAYMVSDRDLPVPGLTEFLNKQLPGYMIPAFFMRLEQMPLTVNGKVDRKALPAPQIRVEKRYAAPGNRLEETLVDLWARVLKLDRTSIGIDTGFFELGGHSLRATIVAANIHKELDIKVPLAVIFKTPTIRALARYIEGKTRDKFISIPPVEEKEYYSLSPAQKRLYILQQLQGDNTGYNECSVVELEGNLDRDKLERIFRQLIERHDSFRTYFVRVGDDIVQRIAPGVEFAVDYTEVEGEGLQGLAARFVRPFNLAEAPLLRVELVRFGEKRHWLIYDIHHIITDGTSLAVLMKEFAALYLGELSEPLRIQYKDYSQWQNSVEGKEALQRQESYWVGEFREEIPVLELYTDYPRPEFQGFAGDRMHFVLGEEETRALKACALEQDVTLFMLLLGVYNVLLSRLSGQEDIVVGTPIAARRHADLQRIIGMFVNTLALRNYPGGDRRFSDFLKEIKAGTLKAFENQEYPFEELVEKLTVQRVLGRNPLFDTIFAVQNMDAQVPGIPEAQIADLELKQPELPWKISKFDLSMHVNEADEELLFTLEYSTALFNRETVERFYGYFIRAASAAAADPLKKLHQLEIMSAEGKERILYQFNDTAMEYPREKTIPALFKEQVELTPDRIALVDDPAQLTYRALQERSQRLAKGLREQGVGPDTIVGIMMNRCLEMMIGILGILKAGGAYFPIDPGYPRERIDYMLKDSSTKILLTADEIASLFREGVFTPGVFPNSSAGHPFTSHPSPFIAHNSHNSANLAYIMYTSGSTGKPRGVMVGQRNVVRLVMNTDFVELSERTRILETGAPVFDATTFETWGSLLKGGMLCLVGNEVILGAGKLGRALQDHRINTLWLTSPLFNQLMQQDSGIFAPLEYLVVGGDVLSPRAINEVRHRHRHLNVVNGYGPTENTTFSASHRIQRDYEHNIPIGKPIANSTAYIVDKYGYLQPVGVPGHLVVGGDGISRGYLNNPELTCEKFDHDLWDYHNKTLLRGVQGGGFLEKSPPGRRRLYKTGDLARWLPEGVIEFLGRLDDQVKIRGFRVEPGEIENRLLKHEKIKEAVVTVVKNEEGSGDRLLCAYFTGSREFDLSELREYLARELPGYMIPAYFVPLEKMPLTANGKLDRKALPAPRLKPGQEYDVPVDGIEVQILEIWAKVLGMSKNAIGVQEDFFHLGGHSLKATLLASRISKTFNVEFPLTAVFIGPTIREMAVTVRQSRERIYEEIKPVEKKEYYPQSSAQKRLFFLEQFENIGIAYNIPSLLKMKGKLEIGRFGAALKALRCRHETLRTSLKLVNNEPVQIVRETADFKIEEPGISKPADKIAIDEVFKQFVRPFDLSRAPLFRVGFVSLSQEESLLLYDLHHIIGDGTSLGILIDDFLRLYTGKELSPLKVQYKDFTVWQSRVIESGEMKKQEEYWLTIFKVPPPKLDFPTDYPRPGSLSFAGNRYVFELEETDAAAVKALAVENGATLFMVSMAVFYVLLYKYCGQRDIIVGTGIMGRPHVDLMHNIGMFVNSLAIRNYPCGEKTFAEFLAEVKESCIQAFAHQDVQFEELVDRLNLERDPSRNPLFDVLLVVQNFEQAKLEQVHQSLLDNVRVTPYAQENKTCKFDLNLSVWERDKEILFHLEYATALFKPSTIREIAANYLEIIKQVIQRREIPLEEVAIANGLQEVNANLSPLDKSEFNF